MMESTNKRRHQCRGRFWAVSRLQLKATLVGNIIIVTSSSNPRHCLLFDYYGRGGSKVTILRQYGIDSSSKSEVLEEPTLHRIYRDSGNGQTFQSCLAVASISDIKEADVLGETLLLKAVKSKDVNLSKQSINAVYLALLVSLLCVAVRQLLDYGISVNQSNKHGYTCLQIACNMFQASEMVRYLLDSGADPMVGNHWQPNRNALAAAVSMNRHETIASLLNQNSGDWQHTIRASEWMNLVRDSSLIPFDD